MSGLNRTNVELKVERAKAKAAFFPCIVTHQKSRTYTVVTPENHRYLCGFSTDEQGLRFGWCRCAAGSRDEACFHVAAAAAKDDELFPVEAAISKLLRGEVLNDEMLLRVRKALLCVPSDNVRFVTVARLLRSVGSESVVCADEVEAVKRMVA